MVDTKSKWVIEIKDEETNSFRTISNDEMHNYGRYGYYQSEYLSKRNVEIAIEKMHQSYRLEMMRDMKERKGIHRGRDAKEYNKKMYQVADIKFRHVEYQIGA